MDSSFLGDPHPISPHPILPHRRPASHTIASTTATAIAASSQNLGAMEEERIEEINVRLVGRTGGGNGSASV
ncbi:hypothetical protein CsSME_00028673 [Camellia sinensis var. sinensis]